jgi:hypothetical protein
MMFERLIFLSGHFLGRTGYPVGNSTCNLKWVLEIFYFILNYRVVNACLSIFNCLKNFLKEI